MQFINQILIMSFLGIIATCCIVFPILYLVQKRKHHKEILEILKELKKSDE